MSIHDVNNLLNSHYNETTEKADQLLQILEPLIKIYSPTGKEKRIIEYVKSEIRRIRINDVKVKSDKIGNIYLETLSAIDNPKILLNAHADVHPTADYTEESLMSISLRNKYDRRTGLLKPKAYDTIQLGYDDKIGVAIILWMLKYHPECHFKALFTVQEEANDNTPENLKEKYKKYNRKGGVGIEYALQNNPGFFEHVSAVLLIDRAEDKHDEKHFSPIINKKMYTREDESDIIWRYYNENMCSNLFKNSFKRLTQRLGTQMEARGSAAKADAYNIRKRFPQIDIINLAAGGYNEHQENDYINIYESVRTLRVLEEIIKKYQDRNNRNVELNHNFSGIHNTNRPGRTVFRSSAKRCSEMIENNDPCRTKAFVENWNEIQKHLFSIRDVENGLNRFGFYRENMYHEFFSSLKKNRSQIRLLYPGSGRDIFEPMCFLSPYVKEFYFVDLNGRTIFNPNLLTSFNICGIKCEEYSIQKTENSRYLRCTFDYQGNKSTMYYFSSSWQDLYAWLLKNKLRISILYAFDTGGEGGVDFSLDENFVSSVLTPILADRFILYGQSYPNAGDHDIKYGKLESKIKLK